LIIGSMIGLLIGLKKKNKLERLQWVAGRVQGVERYRGMGGSKKLGWKWWEAQLLASTSLLMQLWSINAKLRKKGAAGYGKR